MTMFGGGRDDDADENKEFGWLNAPLSEPDRDNIRPVVISWLEMLRRNEDPSWDAMGGNDEGVTLDDVANIIMEEASPTTSRNLMLNEYDVQGGSRTTAGFDELLGSESFRDDVEEHIMGYPQGWDSGAEHIDELVGGNTSRQDINFTSKDPLFTLSADTIFDTVWDMMKTEKGKFRGYTRNRISDRAERQGKARAWSQSRKVKRGRTRKRYARNKKRGNVRPQMRRQLGAGGKREQVKR